jgi:hypothetical protein
VPLHALHRQEQPADSIRTCPSGYFLRQARSTGATFLASIMLIVGRSGLSQARSEDEGRMEKGKGDSGPTAL